MWVLKVFAVIYLAALCAAENVIESITRAPVTTVYVPPVPSVQLKSTTWDVYLSEKVVLSCTVDGSSEWTFTWFRDGQELRDAQGFSFPGDGSVLTVSAENENQSGSYTCKGKHRTRGVSTKDSSKPCNIKVNKPPTPTLKQLTPWLDVFENEEVRLTCGVSSSDWTLTWYRNGEKVTHEGSFLHISSVSQTHQGQYTCKAHLKSRGVSSDFSDPVTVTVYAKKPKPKLTRDPVFNQMYPGESVNFTCMVVVSSGWEYEWYHKGSKIPESSSNTLVIPSLAQSNSGEYHCKAKRGQRPFYTEESDTKSLQISDPPKPTLKQLTPWLDVFENEEVRLTCGVSSSDWTFTWYRNGKKLTDEGSFLNISSVSQTHQGQYTCKAHLTYRGVSSDFSDPVTVTVYAKKPKPKLTRDPVFNQMYPGESVTFTCMVDVSSGWEYEWYHKGSKIPESSSNTLVIPSLAQSNSGEYHCKAKRGQRPFYTEESDTKSLQISDPPKPTLKQLTPWLDVFENEEVRLTCGVSSSNWTFTWYRNGKNLTDEGSFLIISSVSQTHQGQYTCKAHLTYRGVNSDFSDPVTVTVYENVPVPKLGKDPSFDPMYIGERVNFTCRVHVSSGWNYEWFKDGHNLGKSGDTISIFLDLSKGGQYSCRANRSKNTETRHSEKITQVVKEVPVPSLKKVTQWLDVFPTESVKLSCGMKGSTGWTYTWYKDEKEVRADNTVTFDKNRMNLSIGSVSRSHRGSYRCSGKLRGRSVSSNSSSKITLEVYDTPPGVTLKNSESSLHTSDSVTFSCQVSNSSGWDYVWYKDGKQLVTSGNTHNITSVKESDTGSYKCQVKRGAPPVLFPNHSQDVNITVEERPQASIILLTGWSDVFSTDSLVLKCEVTNSNDHWNYTWFRGVERVNLPPSQKYTVTPMDDPEQSQYMCQGIRSGKPSYSNKSVSFRTKNLLLKRRILLSISGCLFFGIIVVLLGCIFLRVFRKPAAADEKPDEANLFLTMAQLKDRTDAPCPLVDYITDADVIAPPKEDDGNGKVCSETTPLPITSQEDQAVTTESHDTTENGVGMVSFQQ